MWALAVLAFVALEVVISESATCGGSEFFEYKFRPIKIHPSDRTADLKKFSKKRCGEADCDMIVTLNGEPKCKSNRHSKLLSGPHDKTIVNENQFTPAQVDYETFSKDALSRAKDTPFSVEVCDKDKIFRGGHDSLIQKNRQRLQEGCTEFTDQDDTEMPLTFKYEICCRKLRSN